MKNFIDYGITIPPGREGEIKTLCPKCSHTRKKNTAPCLNVNTEAGLWHCWHCEWSGSLKRGEDREHPAFRQIKKEYKKPAPMANPNVSAQWMSWLSMRRISAEVVRRNRLFSTSIYMPQTSGEVDAIAFPYYRDGELVNVKYRDADKHFRLHAGAERVLGGIDDIDPACLVWVEGEMDKLSIETAGIISCVTVPDGAPSPTAKSFSSKFDFMESCEAMLESVDRHILAVDNDAPGKALEEELARRLGPGKCWVVKWPAGCKDANDTLCKHGTVAIAQALHEATPYPVAGIFTIDDVSDRMMAAYTEGVKRGMKTGWIAVDSLYTVREGEWTVVTGIPGHGKSEWLDALMVNLATTFGWRFAICSPENQPIEQHAIKLAEKLIGLPFNRGSHARMNEDQLSTAMNWLREYFDWILPDPITIDDILKRALVLVKRRGIKGLVIDPWNEIESQRPDKMSETEWISSALSKFRRFARENSVHLWIVAHPTKLQKDNKGVYPCPTPYDISGSSHWRNKADNAIAVWRDVSKQGSPVEVHVQKIRFKIIGKIGVARLKYDTVTGRYYDESEPMHAAYEQEEYWHK